MRVYHLDRMKCEECGEVATRLYKINHVYIRALCVMCVESMVKEGIEVNEQLTTIDPE